MSIEVTENKALPDSAYPLSDSNKSLNRKGSVELTKSEKPTEMDYFKGARVLVYCTFGAIIISFILIVFAEWLGKGCVSDKVLAIVKDFLYPFLTLMIGYMFGRGFSNKEKTAE